AMYRLPLGLSKEIYAGPTSLFFTVGNATKAVPWLLLVKPGADVWTLMAVCLFAIPAGVWLGWRLHGTLDQRQIYRACYGLLGGTALKLLWDGISGSQLPNGSRDGRIGARQIDPSWSGTKTEKRDVYTPGVQG